jgi:endonuclease YncB( thermonuclease family)
MWLNRFLKVIFFPSNLLILWIIVTLYKTYEHKKEWEQTCIKKVIDGDTIEFFSKSDSSIFPGRLVYIDAFELKQPVVGRMSFMALKEQVYGPQKKAQPYSYGSKALDNPSQCITIYTKIMGEDIYKRKLILLKKHINDVETINEKLLKRGKVLLYPRSSFDKLWEKRLWLSWQDFAKRTKQGVWKNKKTIKWMTPWNFRKKTKLKKLTEDYSMDVKK